MRADGRAEKCDRLRRQWMRKQRDERRRNRSEHLLFAGSVFRKRLRGRAGVFLCDGAARFVRAATRLATLLTPRVDQNARRRGQPHGRDEDRDGKQKNCGETPDHYVLDST